MSSRLSRFEELAERLVEGSLSRLFAGGLHPQDVAAKMARAMEDVATGNLAPDRFSVRLSPEDHAALLAAEPELAKMLSDQLVGLAEQAGLVLYRDPVVEFVADPAEPRHNVTIIAETSGDASDHTRAFEPVRARELLQQEPDGSIYLIVDGGRHFTLTNTVYTLGRRTDCDIVLADSRVSRRHAQLRWRAGRYVLFDVGSTGGTTVNGRRIREAVLEPGDVFSLGGVDIIFGIETPDGDLGGDRAPTRPFSGATKGAKARSSQTL